MMMTMRMTEPRMDVPFDPCNSVTDGPTSSPSPSTLLLDNGTMEQVLGDSFGHLSLQSPRRKSLRSEDVVDVERLRFETKKLL